MRHYSRPRDMVVTAGARRCCHWRCCNCNQEPAETHTLFRIYLRPAGQMIQIESPVICSTFLWYVGEGVVSNVLVMGVSALTAPPLVR